MALSPLLLDRLLQETDATTDYQIAKLLGVKPTTVYRWRKGKSAMDDAALVQVAEILGEDPMKLIAQANYTRAKTDREINIWSRYITGNFVICLALLPFLTLLRLLADTGQCILC